MSFVMPPPRTFPCSVSTALTCQNFDGVGFSNSRPQQQQQQPLNHKQDTPMKLPALLRFINKFNQHTENLQWRATMCSILIHCYLCMQFFPPFLFGDRFLIHGSSAHSCCKSFLNYSLSRMNIVECYVWFESKLENKNSILV